MISECISSQIPKKSSSTQRQNGDNREEHKLRVYIVIQNSIKKTMNI